MNIDKAIVYDIETYPNCFTFEMQFLKSKERAVWEISEFRDDRASLYQFFQWLAQTQTPMIGFNIIHFDYNVIHEFWKNTNISYQALYQKAMSIIESQNSFGNNIWASDRFAPQIDLFKIHHFDNKAKSTNLKALQINMRSPTVVDLPIEVGTWLTKEQIDTHLVPYGGHDVEKTKDFAWHSMDAINFRIGLIEQFGIDVLNWNDTKIGEQMVINRLGDELCYDRSSGRRQTRQTVRSQIALKDIIFPYVKFEHPELNRILDYMRSQVLRSEQINQFSEDSPSIIKTKGVFTDLTANINGFELHYGVGGIHGSIERKKIIATDEWLLRDIDVASLYPSIAIVNNLAPEHLGAAFTTIYSELPKERKKWQIEKGKKCIEANALKLASNGVYGKSNSFYSPFYDPQFTITITVNGQLMLSMLFEQLLKVPTLEPVQINTDGVTYYVRRDYERMAAQICREWEKTTRLTLEDADYSKMFIRDVNSYIAVSKDGSLKLKGAYWTPDPLDYAGSISNAQPPAWHKNISNVVSTRAAVSYMVHGVDIETFVRLNTNPYDFMCAVKVRKSDKLLWGDEQQQRNTRYFVSVNGRPLVKNAPSKGTFGAYKKANGISDGEYAKVMKETNGQWDVRVCTKNKSKYEDSRTAIAAGYNVTVCNNVKDFDFNNVNYSWYVNEAKKLLTNV